MITYLVTDDAQDREALVSSDDRPAALKRVYETLCHWNDDRADCSDAIAAGRIGTHVYKAPIYCDLDADPVAFWTACATVMCDDNQDFNEVMA